MKEAVMKLCKGKDHMEQTSERPLNLYKNEPTDTIQWIAHRDETGKFEFTFDGGKTVFNLFRDYPKKLTPEQVEIFDKENPFWAEFFADRK